MKSSTLNPARSASAASVSSGSMLFSGVEAASPAPAIASCTRLVTASENIGVLHSITLSGTGVAGSVRPLNTHDCELYMSQ